MSNSEQSADADPRFRIPRGNSDEEIDSDLASVRSAVPPSPSSPPPPTVASTTPNRNSVTKTVSSLKTGLGTLDPSFPTSHELPDDVADEDDKDSGDDDPGDGDGDGDGHNANGAIPSSATLANITAAATNRTLHLAESRRVDITSVAAPRAPVTGVGEAPSHPDMMNRILDTLRATSTDTGAPITSSLPTLQKKVQRLHTEKKSQLAVPLPGPLSARLERVAAYKQTKTQVSEKWGNTVRHLRRSDHLVFPLNEKRTVQSSANLAARPPANKSSVEDHEREIADILLKAGVGDDGHIQRSEEKAIGNALVAGKITKDDVVRRQRELARVRSLVFHYDQKMKRIKKIKSKKFRRLMKKEREKIEDAEDAANPEAQLEETIAAERRRIEERVTLRHKNTSKWIRRQLRRGEGKGESDTRGAIEDQLRLHEELKRRQKSELHSGDSESDDDSADDDGDLEGREETELTQMEEEMEKEGPQSEKQLPKKGIMGLRFMQAAEERKRKDALALLAEMRRDDDEESEEEKLVGRMDFAGTVRKDSAGTKGAPLNVVEDESDEDGDDGVGDDGNEAEIARLEKRLKDEYDEAEGNGGMGDKTNGAVNVETAAQVIRSANESKSKFTTRLDGRLKADDNPWLNGFVYGNEHTPSKGLKLSGADSVTKETKKRKRKDIIDPVDNCDGKAIARLEKTKLITISKEGKHLKRHRIQDVDSPSSGAKGRKTAENYSAKMSSHELDGEERNLNHPRAKKEVTEAKEMIVFGEEPGDQDQSPKKGDELKEKSAAGDADHKESEYNETAGNDEDNEDLSRMEMIAEAFAGAGGADEADFEAAKEADVEKSLPTAKSMNAEMLPGWGHWHGAGMSKQHEKKSRETPFAQAARARLEAARQNAVKSRSDRNMRNVILEEKRYRSATKLTLGSVPYPYQSREEWERELSRPLCRELVSDKAFSSNVRPRVEARLGKALGPIEEPVVLGDSRNDGQLLKRSKGKKGVIELRKEKATHRAKARRSFLS